MVAAHDDDDDKDNNNDNDNDDDNDNDSDGDDNEGGGQGVDLAGEVCFVRKAATRAQINPVKAPPT